MSEAAPSCAYLLLSGVLAIVWTMLLRIRLGTVPLGLTEPVFVPAYWNPPTLFRGVGWRA